MILSVAWIGSTAPEKIAAAAAKTSIAPCGASSAAHDLVEPPDVDMWKAPVDASGVHELILGVHNESAGFCYRYTWNGTLYAIAPTIHVRRGEHFAIRIADDIVSQSTGESLPSTAMLPCKPMEMPKSSVEHWTGYLNHVIDDRLMRITDRDSNLHLHGFEGPASMENVFLSALSTPLHACEYVVTIPRTQPPGTYFYHPHAHGSSDDEVAGGLDGAWIVDPDSPQMPRSDEHVLIIRYHIPFELDNSYAPRDIPIFRLGAEHEGAQAPAPPVRYDPFDPPPWPVSWPLQAGGVHLDPAGCNGTPSEAVVTIDDALTPATLAVPAGSTQLLRVVNGTSDSAKLLELRDSSGTVQALHIVGLDGVPVSGDMERPFSKYLSLDRLMLPPMSRANILLTANAGTTYTLSSEPYCSGSDGFFQMHHDLLHITGVTAPRDPAAIASEPISVSQTPAARLLAFVRAHPSLVHRRAITFTEYAFPKRGKSRAHLAFYITDTTNRDFREHPFWPVYRNGAIVPSNPDIVVKRGAIEEWYLINATLETHAFHIHQMAFVQERTYEGVPATIDTVFVPVGTLLPNPRDPNYPLVRPSITRVILDFRHVPKGEFVFHCHMLFHEDRGMMGVIRVE